MIDLTTPLAIEITQADIVATKDDQEKRRLDVWIRLYTEDREPCGNPVLLSLADFDGNPENLSYRLVLDSTGHPGVESVEVERGYSDGRAAMLAGRLNSYLKDEGMI